MTPNRTHPTTHASATLDMSPANLHVSPFNAAFPGPRLSERVEQKFFVRPDRMDLAFGLLLRTCRRDPLFPDGHINSLYFDTYDLAEHRRSDAGDSDKDKIRIRWYGDRLDPHRSGADEALPTTPAETSYDGAHQDGQTVQVWLERKSRRGFASTKQRLAVDIPAAAVDSGALPQGIVPATLLIETMGNFGYFPPKGRFCPVAVISYARYRFIEPVTGFRISIDWRVRSSLVMPGLGRGERGLELSGAVVEVKGPRFDMPPALRPLADIGSTWTRFSKYSSSLDAHSADLGTVSRNWPSGVMEREPGHIGWVPVTQATQDQ